MIKYDVYFLGITLAGEVGFDLGGGARLCPTHSALLEDSALLKVRDY